ncbi:hypothetical protein [Flavobacterium seoulense]|uniref:YD repeat-containing protein n=1 Tax=Flavobacterium seoulense TaxID=1492738 RepID=A0A066WQ44_9FLAO|nr:hypothetical protein [Flavobacterium seoulense]KDN54693.1 hypothetical protein FEM21_22070 [Flavobacterium seoulense]
MKKVIYLLLIISNTIFSQNQEIKSKDDIKTPSNHDSGVDLGSSLNSSTGKIKETLDIASIACRSVNYNISFNYDGTNVFKQAQYQNRYFPTSILGVGWNMGVPKIIADTKQTASRDDDTFYLNGVELICVQRPSVPNSPILTEGPRIWEFKAKKNLPYIIKYYESNIVYDLSNYYTTVLDYWLVIDEKGKTYIYGNTDNTRENVIAWDNWIGDSKEINGASTHTTTWNLSILKDQWNNELEFSYLKTEQRVNTTGPTHTEASYLKQITSKTGEKIVLNYTLKNPVEYYEPHTEMVEPDAYQERYEKYFLNSVVCYNSNNQIVTNTVLDYKLESASNLENTKRYLTEVTKKSVFDSSLGSQKYEYYTSGIFAGGLKTKTNPKGGAITYTYEQKLLFNNNNNTIGGNSLNNPFNSTLFAKYQSDNYKLDLYTNGTSINNFGNRDTPMVPFLIDRYDWNGRAWIKSKFYFPENIRLINPTASTGNFILDNVKFVFGDDFYAALIYDRNTKKGSLYLFHKLSDGTWSTITKTNLNTGGKNNDDFTEDPVLLSTENFIAIGNNKSGELYTYTWNNSSWNEKLISQNSGTYYYEAKNNFIISVNSVTGIDMPTIDVPSNQSHYDRYYFHYLNAEKNWQTKSWTNYATYHIGDISSKSAIYASNSICTLVAGDNPEFLMRWDSNYNLNRVDNVLGAYDDNYPFLSIGNNIFSGLKIGGRSKLFRAVAISGAKNFVTDLNIETTQGFGENKLLGLRWINNSYAHDFRRFNPNTSSWMATDLPMINKSFNYHYISGYAFAQDLFISGQTIYGTYNQGYSAISQITNYDYPSFCFSGGDYIFGSFWSIGTNNNVGEAKYFYIDKINGQLQSVLLQTVPSQLHMPNRQGQQFGGQFPFFTRKNLNGIKLIDNKINNNIYDIVISQIKSDNGLGSITYTNYSYTDSNTLFDDSTIIYGKVTDEEKGSGSSSNGKTIKYFNKGDLDLTRTGQLMKEEYYDKLGNLLKEINYLYEKKLNSIYNSINSSNPIYTFDVWNKKSTEEKVFFQSGNNVLTSNTDFKYDENGNLIQTCRMNSLGENECSNITYSENIYPFLKEKNFIGFMNKKITEINDNIVAVEKINWIQNGNYCYIKENLSGTNETTLRVNNQIEVVDNYGNVVETSNGKGLSNCVLMGYNYRFPIATINNSKYNDVISALSVNYSDLQNMTGNNLKTELLKLYNVLPNTSSLSLKIYDENGNVILSIDNRKNETNYVYDEFNRVKYVTNKYGKIIINKNYHIAK